MQTIHSRAPSDGRWLSRFFHHSAEAPLEIYGATDRGCSPGEDYLYQGFRYVRDPERDVLIREDLQHGRQ
jgi:hypothetical protein